jgi:hypothetical protein
MHRRGPVDLNEAVDVTVPMRAPRLRARELDGPEPASVERCRIDP